MNNFFVEQVRTREAYMACGAAAKAAENPADGGTQGKNGHFLDGHAVDFRSLRW
jgi:hypothetical protein